MGVGLGGHVPGGGPNGGCLACPQQGAAQSWHGHHGHHGRWPLSRGTKGSGGRRGTVAARGSLGAGARSRPPPAPPPTTAAPAAAQRAVPCPCARSTFVTPSVSSRDRVCRAPRSLCGRRWRAGLSLGGVRRGGPGNRAHPTPPRAASRGARAQTRRAAHSPRGRSRSSEAGPVLRTWGRGVGGAGYCRKQDTAASSCGEGGPSRVPDAPAHRGAALPRLLPAGGAPRGVRAGITATPRLPSPSGQGRSGADASAGLRASGSASPFLPRPRRGTAAGNSRGQPRAFRRQAPEPAKRVSLLFPFSDDWTGAREGA